MSIQAINNSNSAVKAQTFKSTMPVVEQTYENDKSSNTKYWVWGGLAALAAVGTYLIMRNRSKKVSNAEVKETVAEIKKMTLEEFKKDGNKFDSGRATNSKGEMFTGIIKKENSDKSVLTLEYKNGLLQKSSKVKDGTTVFNKIYTHNASGNLRNVVNKDGKSLEIKVENDVKTIRTTKNNSLTYDIDKKKLLSYQKDKGPKKEYYYRNDDSKKLKYVKENDKITKYAEDGKTEVFTATEAEVQEITTLCKDLGKKFDFSELKNLTAYIKDKWGRARGTIVGGDAIPAPKVKFPKGSDYADIIKKIKEGIPIKKAFEETKNGHYI